MCLQLLLLCGGLRRAGCHPLVLTASECVSTVSRHMQGCDSDSEQYDAGSPNSQSASPTIPAMRASPFQAGTPVPPLLGLPRVKAPLPGPQQPAPSPLPQLSGDRAMPVPRLDLSHSMHSTLEARNASAELQVRVFAVLVSWVSCTVVVAAQ